MTTKSEIKDRIVEGDEVIVFCRDYEIYGIVRYIPQATGDCWIIETDSFLYYIQQFDLIRKAKENDNGRSKLE